MDLPHHLAELLADLQVPQRVVVVDHQGRDPRHELVQLRVVVEAVPEDGLGRFSLERGESVPHAGRDEVDAVVPVPVLEAMLPVPEFVGGVGGFADGGHSECQA
jgi:hypothetical protein